MHFPWLQPGLALLHLGAGSAAEPHARDQIPTLLWGARVLIPELNAYPLPHLFNSTLQQLQNCLPGSTDTGFFNNAYWSMVFPRILISMGNVAPGTVLLRFE